jgi:hypothetical protein
MKNKLLLLAMGFALTTQMIMAQVPSYVPTNGLIGYWPFNGNANDESGNGNNGITDGATLTNDRFESTNSAYSFNGIDNLISIVSSTHPTGNASITYSVWFYCLNNIGDKSLLNVGENGIQNKRSAITIGAESTINYVTQNNDLNSNYNIPTNQWHNLIISKSVNFISFYIDGLLINTGSLSSIQNLTNTKIVFGGNGTSWGIPNGEHYNGKLDDIGIWNRALTQDEIISLYQAEVSCQSLVINSGTLSSFNPLVYQSTVTIYPNPANEQITIDCGNLANVSGWTIKIVNTLGQEVFSGAMNTQQYVVPLNSWSGQGMYFVKIINAQNEVVNIKKIILQ